MVRSDGTQILVGPNAWTTDKTFDASGGAHTDYEFHLLDYNGTGSYTLYFTSSAAPAAMQDIVNLVRDPESGAAVSADMEFSQPIDLSTFNYHDLTLTCNGGANLITNAVTISAVAGMTATYRITGLDGLTAADGAYQLTASTAGVVDDGGNQATGSATIRWSQGNAAPYVDHFESVPAFRNTPLSTIEVVFSEPIDPAAFDYQDISLSLDGGPNLITSTVTVVQVSGATFDIGGIGTLSSAEGNYVLTVDATGVKTLGGLAGFGSASVAWTMDTTPPTIVSLQQPQTPRNTVVQWLDVTMSEPIDLSTFDLSHVTLTLGGGPNLIDNRVTIAPETEGIPPASGAVYRISGFNWVVGQNGSYQLTVDADGILDLAGNVGSGSASSSWVMDTTPPSPASNLAIAPDTGLSSTDGITNTGAVTLTGALGEPGLSVHVEEYLDLDRSRLCHGDRRQLQHALAACTWRPRTAAPGDRRGRERGSGEPARPAGQFLRRLRRHHDAHGDQRQRDPAQSGNHASLQRRRDFQRADQHCYASAGAESDPGQQSYEPDRRRGERCAASRHGRDV